jgi:hypothetical protein
MILLQVICGIQCILIIYLVFFRKTTKIYKINHNPQKVIEKINNYKKEQEAVSFAMQINARNKFMEEHLKNQIELEDKEHEIDMEAFKKLIELYEGDNA